MFFKKSNKCCYVDNKSDGKYMNHGVLFVYKNSLGDKMLINKVPFSTAS